MKISVFTWRLLYGVFPVNVAASCPPDQPFLTGCVVNFIGGLGTLRILQLANVQAEDRFLWNSGVPFLAAGSNSGQVLLGQVSLWNPPAGIDRITAGVKTFRRAGTRVRNAKRILR